MIGSAGDSRVVGGFGKWQPWLWRLHQQCRSVQGLSPWKCEYFISSWWFPLLLFFSAYTEKPRKFAFL